MIFFLMIIKKRCGQRQTIIPVKNGTTISSRQSLLSTNLGMLIPTIKGPYSTVTSDLETSIPQNITRSIGFFRLTPNGKSGANKAYLSIPANKTVDGGVGDTYGYIDFNGQFLGNDTDDDPKNPSLSKMAIVFDDEDDGGSTTTVPEVKLNSTDADASFYTLQGVKVSRPVKGVYIHNGKKFIK